MRRAIDDAVRQTAAAHPDLEPKPPGNRKSMRAVPFARHDTVRVGIVGTGLRGRSVLNEVERLKPFTKFMYTDDPIYSFHSGIPLPPKLGVISLKRFWSGDLTNARLAAELEAVKPGILLLKNNTLELPFNDLIHTQYRLIYEDADHRLYGHRAVLADAKQSR